jgi:hypothetical protein
MIDVRLAATNPEDSTLVPVSCNARGELNTVAPKIEEIPNDLQIDGDLTVTGLINGSDGVGEQGPQGEEGPQGPQGEQGDGVPIPYGKESQVLTIVNSVPAWADSTGGSPQEALTLKNWNSAGQCGDWNNVYQPEDKYQWCKDQSSWNNPSYTEYIGYQVIGNNPPFYPEPMEWELNGVFGKVLTMFYCFKGYRGSGNAGVSSPVITPTWSDSNIVAVNAVYSPASQDARKNTWIQGVGQLTFIFNREVTAATLSHSFTAGGFDENQGICWCGWQLDDAGNYAINKQIRVENQLKELRAKLAMSE